MCKCVFMHYLFAIHFNVCYIVLKHGGDVDFRELVFTEDDQQTGFTACSITDDHQLLTNRCHAYNTPKLQVSQAYTTHILQHQLTVDNCYGHTTHTQTHTSMISHSEVCVIQHVICESHPHTR